MSPKDLLYAETHEWVRVADEGGRKVGTQVKAGDSFGVIESVKAVSDLYSPVEGEVVAVNDTLPGNLEQLHTDPYGVGWIAKIQLKGEPNTSGLMDYAAYQKQCAEEGH